MDFFASNKATSFYGDFIRRKIPIFFIIFMGFLGNFGNMILFASFILRKDFSFGEGNMNSFWVGVIDFLHTYWIFLTIIGLLLMFVHHVLSMLLPLLPEPEDKRFSFGEEKQVHELNPINLNIVVKNKVGKKIENCKIKLISLVHIGENGKETEKITSIGSKFLLWENGNIETSIDETTGDEVSFVTATLTSTEQRNYNVLAFYDGDSEKRLSKKGVYRYKVALSGKGFRPLYHVGYFEFLHDIRKIDEYTFLLDPKNEDMDKEHEHVISLKGDVCKFAKFGFVQKKNQVVFEP